MTGGSEKTEIPATGKLNEYKTQAFFRKQGKLNICPVFRGSAGLVMAAAKLRSGRNPDIKKPALFAQSGLLLQKTEEA
ncbi:MAG: hypothetical protein COW58_13535 [Thalassolituus sp. CG17_big_fil_post_rev_8_21_14_2_50_53_8]|nr:MAG: hypothetical protein COW58_13535 [Thalassolituus sp. CG17_big_fil_post_rev_8_21_14_2_50_53_8]